MKLKEIGRYYELPLAGLKIKEIVYNGMLRLVFDDPEHSFLDLHSEFKVTQFNQTKNFNPREKESIMLFYDLYGKTIVEGKADKYGNLWLCFDNGTEITIEDGPYENWHYTKKSPTSSKDHLFV